jgi:hypothetical protein
MQFPHKLFTFLNIENNNAISWTENGRSFYVKDKDAVKMHFGRKFVPP